MGQPAPDSDSTTPRSKSEFYQQVENSTIEKGIQGVDGNSNVQIQGDQNWIIKNLSILVSQETLILGRFNRRKFYILTFILGSLVLISIIIVFALSKQSKPEAQITLQNSQNSNKT